MKRLAALLCAACILLVACSSPTNLEDKTSTFIPQLDGYIVPDFEAFSNTKNTKQLLGKPIALEGSISQYTMDDKNGNCYLIMETSAGNWFIDIGARDTISELKVTKLCTENHTISVYGTFSGIANIRPFPILELGDEGAIWYHDYGLDYNADYFIQRPPTNEAYEEFFYENIATILAYLKVIQSLSEAYGETHEERSLVYANENDLNKILSLFPKLDKAISEVALYDPVPSAYEDFHTYYLSHTNSIYKYIYDVLELATEFDSDLARWAAIRNESAIEFLPRYILSFEEAKAKIQ